MKERHHRNDSVDSEPFEQPARNWSNYRHAPNFSGAFVLITIGVLFLLNNLGVLPWSVWADLWRFWPVFLILAGLELILGKGWFGRITVGLVSLAVLIIILTYTFAIGLDAQQRADLNARFPWLPDWHWSIQSDQVSKEWTVASADFPSFVSKELSLKVDSGQATISDQTEIPEILSLKATFTPEHHEPSVDTILDGTTLRTTIGSINRPVIGIGWWSEATEDLVLGQTGKPLTLISTLASGEETVTLQKQKMQTFNLTVNSGKATWQFAGQTIPRDRSYIKINSGEATIHIPVNARIRATYTVNSGQLQVGGQGYDGHGTYVSENIVDSVPLLDLDVTVNSGQLTITQD